MYFIGLHFADVWYIIHLAFSGCNGVNMEYLALIVITLISGVVGTGLGGVVGVVLKRD